MAVELLDVAGSALFGNDGKRGWGVHLAIEQLKVAGSAAQVTPARGRHLNPHDLFVLGFCLHTIGRRQLCHKTATWKVMKDEGEVNFGAYWHDTSWR